MNNKAEMSMDDLREVLLENEVTNFDPVAEAFKVGGTQREVLYRMTLGLVHCLVHHLELRCLVQFFIMGRRDNRACIYTLPSK